MTFTLYHFLSSVCLHTGFFKRETKMKLRKRKREQIDKDKNEAEAVGGDETEKWLEKR